MAASRDTLQELLDEFECDMRLLATTHVTTGRFLEIFLVRAKGIAADASTDDREWVSRQLSNILAKYEIKTAGHEHWLH